MNKQMPLRVGDFMILAQYLFCGDKMKLTFLLAPCAGRVNDIPSFMLSNQTGL